MGIDKKYLTDLDIKNTLNVENKNTIKLSYATAGLLNDGSVDTTAEIEPLMIELELGADELKNLTLDIEVEVKIVKQIEASIEADEEAISTERVNNDVLDYSVNNFNTQMLSNKRSDLLIDSAGLQGVILNAVGSAIKEGAMYVIDNKKQILMSAWEKLKELYRYFFKKIRDYTRKAVYAFHKLGDLNRKIFEKLNMFPATMPISTNILKKETIQAVQTGFALFTLLNIKNNSAGRFDFNSLDDRLKFEQLFTTKMFFDIKSVAKDGKLKNREVELLNIVSNKEVLKKYFYKPTMPNGFTIDNSVIIPIAPNVLDVKNNTSFQFLFANSSFYDKDSLDVATSSVVHVDAILDKKTLEGAEISLGKVMDMISINKILNDFVNINSTMIEKEQAAGIEMLEKQIDALRDFNKATSGAPNEDMQKKLKVFQIIYDVLNNVSFSNLIGLLKTFKNCSIAIDMISGDIEDYVTAQKAGENNEQA